MITILLSHWIWGVIYYTGVDNRNRESRDKDPDFKSANNLSWELGKLFSCFGFQLNFALSHRLLWPSDHRNNFQMSSLQIQGCLSEMLLPKIFSSSPWIYIWSTGLNKEIREQISYSGNSELYIVINICFLLKMLPGETHGNRACVHSTQLFLNSYCCAQVTDWHLESPSQGSLHFPEVA